MIRHRTLAPTWGRYTTCSHPPRPGRTDTLPASIVAHISPQINGCARIWRTQMGSFHLHQCPVYKSSTAPRVPRNAVLLLSRQRKSSAPVRRLTITNYADVRLHQRRSFESSLSHSRKRHIRKCILQPCESICGGHVVTYRDNIFLIKYHCPTVTLAAALEEYRHRVFAIRTKVAGH